MTRILFLNKYIVERAVLKVSDEVERDVNTKTWNDLSESELFTELVACILGSKVRYEIAKEYIEKLKKEKILEISHLFKKPKSAEKKIFNTLKKPVYLHSSIKRGIHYPYPKSKARFISQTFYEVYINQVTTIKALLKDCTNEFEVRDMLVKFCMGIGPKQASLFLRNIGYTERLAILDTHVIQYMKVQDLYQGIKIPINITQYKNYEKTLLSYADSMNRSLAKLDIAIWIVMRVIQGDFNGSSSFSFRRD